jgi:hypothetical protein
MVDKQLVPFSFEEKVVVPFKKEAKPLASLPPDHPLLSLFPPVVHVHRHLQKAGRGCTLSHTIAIVKQLRRS